MTLDDLRADVAALHNICRYNGHVARHYSVAEHIAIGLEQLELDGADDDLKRAWLLHDCPEAALGLGDITRDEKLRPEIAKLAHDKEGQWYGDFAFLVPDVTGGVIWAAMRCPRVKELDRRMAVAEVEAVALVEHDSPEDYDPYVHGFIARRIREGTFKLRPIPRLEPWFEKLFGVVL